MLEVKQKQITPSFPKFLSPPPPPPTLEDDLSTLPSSSLRGIHSNTSADFFEERQQGGFVHVMDLVEEAEEGVFDLRTVRSEVLSEMFDTDSTESSLGEEAHYSEVHDIV